MEVGLSDHCLVYTLTVQNKKIPQPKPEIIRVRSFKNFDEGSFCSYLSLIPFSTAYVFDDPEDVYWTCEKLFVEDLNDHAPVKSFRRQHRDQFQFINPELREVMRERNRKPEDWEKYRQLRNRLVSMRRKRVRDHFSRICDDKYSDQKKFWNTIRPYISSRKKQSFHNERIVLKDNGGFIREQKKVAEVLAECFQVLSTLTSINCLQSHTRQ